MAGRVRNGAFPPERQVILSFKDWVRVPSDSMLKTIQQVSEDVTAHKAKAEEYRATGVAPGIGPQGPSVDAIWWIRQRDNLVLDLAMQRATRLYEISLVEHAPARDS